MTHRTKLYQQARSPLIQGRSRIERPLWQGALAGSMLSFMTWMAILAADISGRLELFVHDASFELVDLVPGPALWFLTAALIGGYLGAGLAMEMGWHKGWRTAVVFALVLDLVAYFFVL